MDQVSIYDLFVDMEQSHFIMKNEHKQYLKSIKDDYNIQSFLISRIKKHKSYKLTYNVIKNLAVLDGEITNIDYLINEIIIWMFSNQMHPEFLFYILDNDPRTIRPLSVDLRQYLINLSVSETISTINLIADNTKYSTVNLFLMLFDNDDKSDNAMVREMMVLSSIDNKTKYLILSNVILKGNLNLLKKLNNLFLGDSFANYINDNLCDEDILANSIRNSPLSISDIFNVIRLKFCILDCHLELPKTIDYIYNKATENELGNILLALSNVYDKKKILKSLIKLKNSEIFINLFLKNNKDYSEIKSLIPFV